MSGGATVYLIASDVSLRNKVDRVAKSMSLPAEFYADRRQFFASRSGVDDGCVIAELVHQAADFREFLDEMTRHEITLPAIAIAHQPRTSITVQLMKCGAVTVLEVSSQESDLRTAIAEAMQVNLSRRNQLLQRRNVLRRIASLSDEERKVMELVISGTANKVIARRLNVSVRTVESRRQQVFAKMNVRTVAQLVRAVVTSDPTSVESSTRDSSR